MDSPGRRRQDIQEIMAETGVRQEDWADYQGDPCQVLRLQAGARPGGSGGEDRREGNTRGKVKVEDTAAR